MSRSERPFAVVLAGGVGSRFWPASQPEQPKQLLPLGTDRPLIVDAVDRATALAGVDRTLIVTGGRLAELFREVLPDLSSANFLVEPAARGTGPALAWAAHEIVRRDPSATMVSLHADHVIDPLEEFLHTIDRGVEASGDGRLFSVGVRPSRPETGYGYVRLGAELAPGVHEAAEFVEKPSAERARAYVESGDWVWNSGIFIWQAADLIRAIRNHAPEMPLERLDEGDSEAFFAGCEASAIDVAVMERSDRVGIVSASFSWDDVGEWNALFRTRSPDEAGNVIQGAADLVESADNIVWSETGRVTLFRANGLVVVRSGQHTFVTTREAAGEMKRIFELEPAEAEGGSRGVGEADG